MISLLRSETAANSEDNAEVNTEETPDSTGSTIEAAARMTTAAQAELAANATASMHYLLHLHYLQHEKLSHSERLNILGLQTRVIFDLILCHKYLHGLVNTNNCNFIRICQSSRTIEVRKLYRPIRNGAVSMRDIDSSLIILLICGTLYLQQSSLAPVWLFLNEI